MRPHKTRCRHIGLATNRASTKPNVNRLSIKLSLPVPAPAYLARSACTTEYQPPFSEFLLIFPAPPEVKAVKQSIGATADFLDTVIADFVGKDAYLKAEFFQVPDPNYLQDMTDELAMQGLIDYARIYAIENASFSAVQKDGYWVAEMKGLRQFPIGGEKVASVYRINAYYGKKSILIQHATASVAEYPTQAIMKFLSVRVDARKT